MKDMIIRLSETEEDAEILEVNKVTNQEFFASISLSMLVKKLNDYLKDPYVQNRAKPLLLDQSIIAVSNDFGSIMINQPEHMRIVVYKEKAYKIHFPNAIYIMYQNAGTIDGIKAFAYKTFEGLQTKLYSYPMPNMLGGNMICIGSAPRKIKDSNYVDALENIIFTQYTHSHVNDIKSFKNTVDYFEYLEKNEFPYDLLINGNKVLKDEVA